MKRAWKWFTLFLLVALALCLSVSACASDAVTAELAGEGQSAAGFVCLAAEDGTIYWQTGVEKFSTLLSANGLEEGSVAEIAVIPDNGHDYPYLYPEEAWKILVFAEELPGWYTAETEAAVQAAFETWKEEVYGLFDVVAVRELTVDETLNASPDEDYVATEEDIAAFLQYIQINNSLCTYIKTSVNDTIEAAIGPSVSGDVWNYINRDVAEEAKHAGNVGTMLFEMGVSNVGVVQNDFSGALTGGYFDLDSWNYYNGDIEGYPYACAVYMWEHGLAISEDSSNIWRLHCADGGRILYEISNDEVSLSNAFAAVVTEDGTVHWGAGLDNTDDIRAAEEIAEGGVNIQIKPVLDEAAAEFSLPDGNNPDVTRYFPYLDGASVWTLKILDEETPDWFTEETEAAVQAAFEQWREAIYGGFDFESARSVFTEETKAVSGYTEEDVALLKDWAIAWHNLKDQGMDPTAAIKLSGYRGVGSSLFDDFDAYLLAAWRVQHEACPGDVVQAGFFAAQGITDQEQYDHQVGDVVGDSVSDVMEALSGYFFSNITDWAYYTGDAEGYPYAAGAELVIHNLVPYTDGESWYLASGEASDIVFKISEAELLAE